MLCLHDVTKVVSNAKVESAHMPVGPRVTSSKWPGISIKHGTSSTHYKSPWTGKFTTHYDLQLQSEIFFIYV